jgi:Flp pilus assembly pilin Flp
MSDCLRLWPRLRNDRRAITAMEYALIAGVLVVTIIIGMNVYTSDLSNYFANIGTSI